jgi:thioredoxin-related protein
MIIRTSTEKVAQKETNVNLFIRQIEEMSGVVIAIIKIEKKLCIFCERRKKNTKDRAINTDGSLVPVTTNKVISY